MYSLGLSEANFVGMSIGGWYALNLAINYPKLVKGLTLISNPGIIEGNIGFFVRAGFNMLLGNYGRKKVIKELIGNNSLSGELQGFYELVARYYSISTSNPPLFSDEELRSLVCPIQYIGGLRDKIIDASRVGSRLSEVLPEAEINILEDEGHLILSQFSSIRDFLLRK